MRAMLVATMCCGMAWVTSGCAGTQSTAREPSAWTAEDHGVALHRLASSLATQGDLVRAEQYAMLAVQQGFAVERALPLLLDVCVRSSRISAALHHAEPVLRAHPGDHRLRYVVASLYAALSRSSDAERELALVLRAAPNHSEASALLAQIKEAP